MQLVIFIFAPLSERHELRFDVCEFNLFHLVKGIRLKYIFYIFFYSFHYILSFFSLLAVLILTFFFIKSSNKNHQKQILIAKYSVYTYIQSVFKFLIT